MEKSQIKHEKSKIKVKGCEESQPFLGFWISTKSSNNPAN